MSSCQVRTPAKLWPSAGQLSTAINRPEARQMRAFIRNILFEFKNQRAWLAIYVFGISISSTLAATNSSHLNGTDHTPVPLFAALVLRQGVREGLASPTVHLPISVVTSP